MKQREPYGQMNLGTFLDEEVYPALDRAAVFADLNPQDKGAYYLVCCPACEKREAFVYKGGYVLKCNRLNKCGHTVSLLAYVAGEPAPRGQDFVEAVRTLAQLAGVVFPESEFTEEEREHTQKREARRSVLEAVLSYAQEVLGSSRGEAALAYLRNERGFTEEEIRELGLGLYLSAADVQQFLDKEGHDVQAARDAGLLWDRLEGYILIPWADANGHPLTLYGRWHTKTTPEGKPKTIALPGEGTKGSPLYFDRARKAGHKELVLVEGVFDAALLQARGDTRVVASVAAQLSGLQVETLVRHRIRSVFICGDPDGGGDRGTVANIEALNKAGISSYVVPRLPDGLDPDEFVLRYGIGGWREHVSRAVPGSSFRGLQLLDAITPSSPDHERREAVERILNYDATLRGDRVALDREDLLRLTAERTGYSYEALAELAEDHAARRRREETERAFDKILRDAQADRTNKQDVLEVARDLTASLATLQVRTVEPPPPFSVDRLDQKSKEIPLGKSSGWKTLDNLGVWFNPGELAVLGARTSHGKTSVLVGLLLNWLKDAERKSADELFVFYSAEEPEVRLYYRLLALLSAKTDKTGTEEGWTANEVRDFLRDPHSCESWPHPRLLQSAKECLRSWEDRLLLVYRPAWTVEELVAHARDLAERRTLGAILVDYLQRIPPPEGAFDRRDMQITAVGRALKALAVDITAPVVAAAQINRDPAKTGISIPEGKPYESEAVQSAIRSHHPQLHHLREGGSEQEADLVLGLMNFRTDWQEGVKQESADEESPDRHEERPAATRLEIGTLKNRYGEVGRWGALAFVGRFGLIRDPKRDEV